VTITTSPRTFALEVLASHLRYGDIITGIWSAARNRYDDERILVYGLDIETAPDGTRIAVVHTGPAAGQRQRYVATTGMRIRWER
jgi:hypothetical protein